MTLMPFSAVMTATHAGVMQSAGKIRFDDIGYCAMTSSYNFDPACAEFIESALPHISGQHDGHSVLTETGCDIRLATASLRRRQGFSARNSAVVADSHYGIKLAMTEMVVYHTVSGRQCNLFHNSDTNK